VVLDAWASSPQPEYMPVDSVSFSGRGDGEEDGLIALPPKIESKCRRVYELWGILGCLD